MPHAAASIRCDDSAGRARPIFAEHRANCAQWSGRGLVSHEFSALAFHLGGSARVQQRSAWNLHAGDLHLVPAGEPHRFLAARTDAEFWGAGFSAASLAAAGAAALLEPFQRVREGASPIVRIPLHRQQFLRSLFQELSLATGQAGATHSVQLSLLTLILNEVEQAAAWSSAAQAEGSVVAQSLRFIERHCLEPLTLARVAAAVSRTPSYVTTALTRATGRSAVAWITAGRMAEARRRLLHSGEPVERIAECVGYADATHFIRMFRRAHGMTPAAWRSQQLT